MVVERCVSIDTTDYNQARADGVESGGEIPGQGRYSAG
jgi:hypothetical protein